MAGINSNVRGERYGEGQGCVVYLEYRQPLPAGDLPRVVVMVDNAGIGPRGFDADALDRLRKAEVFWSPPVRDLVEARSRKHTVRALICLTLPAGSPTALLIETPDRAAWGQQVEPEVAP